MPPMVSSVVGFDILQFNIVLSNIFKDVHNYI